MTYAELIKHPEYHLMVGALGPYDATKDYVGPEGSWKVKVIPRTIWGIDINICAYYHDWLYFKGGTEKDRNDADMQFLTDIIKTIIRHEDNWIWGTNSLRKWRACGRAYFYYGAVDAKGAQAFNYFKEKESE